MKIALVHKRLDLKGGTERDLFQTAEGLRDLGHEVHLFCSEYGVKPPRDVVAHPVLVMPLGRTLRLWSFAWFAQSAINKADCDVVVGFGRLWRQDALRCGGGTHRGFLRRLGADGGWRRRFWQNVSVYHQSLLAIEKRQYHPMSPRIIIAVSEQVKRDIIANYSVPAEKIVVLYNGVDKNRFHPARRVEVRDQVRNRWNIPFNAPLVLFVGSGFRRKGLDRLLSIWKSPRLDKVFLLVVGTDARIRQYQSRADSVAPGRIVFAGRQEDIENYYAAADGLVLPSLQEAFGNVVVEALASGLPVVVSRDAGASEIIRGSLAEGIFDRSNKPDTLERKLLWLLEKSSDPCCVQEARKIAEEHSWENHFRKLEAWLLEVGRRSTGGATGI
ncbi:MAG: glycosyltransferase family 4 protein [Candidatus Binatia bacterium]